MKKVSKKIQVDYDKVYMWGRIGMPIEWVANLENVDVDELPKSHKFFKVYDQGRP